MRKGQTEKGRQQLTRTHGEVVRLTNARASELMLGKAWMIDTAPRVCQQNRKTKFEV